MSCEHVFTPKNIAATHSVLETVTLPPAGPVKPTMDLRFTQDTWCIMPDTSVESICVTCTHSHLCSHSLQRENISRRRAQEVGRRREESSLLAPHFPLETTRNVDRRHFATLSNMILCAIATLLRNNRCNTRGQKLQGQTPGGFGDQSQPTPDMTTTSSRARSKASHMHS